VTEITQNNVGIFLGRLLVAPKSRLCSVLALKRAGFSLADVQNDVTCLHACT